jgi:methionyl aminopeptidase
MPPSPLVCFQAALPLQRGGGRALRRATSGAPCMLGGKTAGSGKAKKKAPARATSGGFGNARPVHSEYRYTGKLRPGVCSPPRVVPPEIARPDYARDGKPRGKVPKFPWNINVNSAEDIAKMRVAGRLAREVLDIAGSHVGPGMTTDEIDAVVHDETVKRGAYPSPLNYHRFPKSCCTSINEIVCHGIPDSTVLVEGDIVNVDITLFYDGFHGDCSEMFLVGEVDDRGRQLVRATYECMDRAIEICRPDVAINKIGGVIEEHAEREGLSVVRNFCGHGISSIFHTTPNVLHYKNSDALGIMQPGITFTIEPMIAEGTPKNVTWPDDWTAATADGKRCAQYEHTLLITEDGVERLTAKLPGSPPFFWEV